MGETGYRRATVGNAHGFRHGEDNYWYQPLVFGTNLFTYLASVPPGGFMPPHGHEEDPYELSYYHLDGELELLLEHDTFTVKPGDAVHVDPGVSLGVRNTSGAVARFLLTFNPPPAVQSEDRMLARAQERGQGVKSPKDMAAMAGSTERSVR
jgi:quercetin dioxygenase-like cupin family protein